MHNLHEQTMHTSECSTHNMSRLVQSGKVELLA